MILWVKNNRGILFISKELAPTPIVVSQSGGGGGPKKIRSTLVYQKDPLYSEYTVDEQQELQDIMVVLRLFLKLEG